MRKAGDFMNNKTYDILKFVALLIAPVIVLVSAIVDIWGIPYGAQITATLAAIDVFVGSVVVISKEIYEKKGGVSK